jgi:hypothetical protein
VLGPNKIRKIRLTQNVEKWDNDLPSLWLQIMMDGTVNKARSWNKRPDITNINIFRSGEKFKRKRNYWNFFFREEHRLKFDVYGTATMRISKNRDRN